MVKTYTFKDFCASYPEYVACFKREFPRMYNDFILDDAYIAKFDPVSKRVEIGYKDDYFELE